jgi:hypothetical protein
MKITCPKCKANSKDIEMTANISFIPVIYNENIDEFKVSTPLSHDVEEVNCKCVNCGNTWMWKAYRRNMYIRSV